jgi:hypothetical protein
MNSPETAWATMSGDHRKHLKAPGVTCGDCHRSVTSDGLTVVAPLLHVDGQRAIAFSEPAVTWDAGTRRCSGACHGKNHNALAW